MKKYSMFMCTCTLVNVLYAPTDDIDSEKIKENLNAILTKCNENLGKKNIVSAIENLCQQFPITVITECKRVCAANAQLEADKATVETQQKKEFLTFIQKYIAEPPPTEIPPALSALKVRLGREGVYTQTTVRKARVCSAVMQAINLVAALKASDMKQFEDLVRKTKKDGTKSYATMLNIDTNPLSALMSKYTYAHIMGTTDITNNPLKDFFVSTGKFLEDVGDALGRWGSASGNIKNQKTDLAYIKDLKVPELPKDVAIKEQR